MHLELLLEQARIQELGLSSGRVDEDALSGGAGNHEILLGELEGSDRTAHGCSRAMAGLEAGVELALVLALDVGRIGLLVLVLVAPVVLIVP